MSEIYAEVISDDRQLELFKEDWKSLARRTKAPYATYDQYCDEISSDDVTSMRLVVLREDGDLTALAPFVLRKGRKSYTLGERRLFHLPIWMLQLVGGSFLGELNTSLIHYIFEALKTRNEFDLIPFGEMELNGAFHRTLEDGLTNSSWRCARLSHKISHHWLIDFPSAFDDYMAGFSGKLRQTLRRKVRKFDNDHEGVIKVISRVDEVDEFLDIGEKISRLTYQWHVGQRLCADEPTRKSFKAAAEDGSLRCYLLYARQIPCAFIRGTIRDGIYHYDTPGFHPEYNKASPGTVLLLKAVEDLITNTNCKTFDFGGGGDMTGYKKTFGNRSYAAISLEVGRTWKPYTLLLFGVQDVLSTLKRLGNAVLSDDLKRSIKQRIRKYSIE